VPYLWGTTIFAIDGRESFGQIPNTLNELKKLKSKGVRIGVLDDPFEMSARILGDNIEKCAKKNFKKFFSNIGSCGEAYTESKLGFSPEDFVTTSDEFLQREKIAVYTWQGSVFMNLKNAPWLKFGLPLNHPVIGADYICVLKNSSFSREKKKMLLRIVERISNKKNTTFNVESSQYFSPYENHFSGLNPLVLKLYNDLRKKMSESNPIFLTTPSKSEHKEINSWWKKVRYENK
jgi:spermidine/putrescine-binding protein